MQPVVKISIIIPSRISAYEKIEKLKRAILSLLNQTIGKELYEIILIDDGSEINLKHELKDFIEKKDVILLHQEKKGPAAARNLGIKRANGEILLFLGDDIMAASNLLQEHLRIHREHNNCAVINRTTYPADLNEFTKLTMGGSECEKSEGVECRISNEIGFCTACVSIKKKSLGDELFDEDFKDAAYEDTELGIRLDKKGIKIVFTSKTSVCHEHIHDIQSISEQSKNRGKASVYLKKKHPISNISISGTSSGFIYNIKKLVYATSYIFIKRIPAQKMPRIYARIICNYNTMLGIEEGKRLWLKKPKER